MDKKLLGINIKNIDIEIVMSRIEVYLSELESWNKKIALISSTENIFQRHILDSLQLKDLINKNQVILDIGTGQGLPGIIMAFACDNKFYLLDSNNKKLQFLRSVKAKLKLRNVEIIHSRIEDFSKDVDVVVSRAFATIDKTLRLTNKNIKHIFMKGKSYLEEIEEAKINWGFEYDIIQSKTSNEGKIIVIDNIRSL